MDLGGMFTSLVEKLEGWVEALILLLPNFVIAILVALLGFAAARVVRKVVSSVMGRLSRHAQVNNLLATLAYVIVLLFGLFTALGIVGLDDTVTTLLAVIGIIGLALGFAFQDIAENFIAGVLMAFRRPLENGDLVETNDFFGTVKDVNLRTTVLRTLDGKDVLIPNKAVFQNPIVNYSRTPDLRVDVGCGVSYGDDLEAAEQVAREAVSAVSARDTSRPVELFYEAFGDSSINFTVRFWIPFHRQPDYLGARSEAIKRIKRAFDEHGITIPFPIRTLDFGIVGGEKLSDVLPKRFYEERGDGAG